MNWLTSTACIPSQPQNTMGFAAFKSIHFTGAVLAVALLYVSHTWLVNKLTVTQGQCSLPLNPSLVAVSVSECVE